MRRKIVNLLEQWRPLRELNSALDVFSGDKPPRSADIVDFTTRTPR